MNSKPHQSTPNPGDGPQGRPWVEAFAALDPQRQEPVLQVARALQEKGFRAWLVGGAVRDLCLGAAVGDLDMVSAATPDQALEIFPGAREIGKSFGIVQVLGPGERQENAIELATFRLEEGYQDGRHPDQVRFTDSLELDAQRRDFTCNAMYMDPLNMELADPTGGLPDLASKELRCVGEAADRFAEDGLRLLRVARFLARFDLQPAPGLLEAARDSRASLRGVSAERIYGEFERMARGHRPDRAFWALSESGLLGPAFGAGQGGDPGDGALRVAMAGELWAHTERQPELGADASCMAWFALGMEADWRGVQGGPGSAKLALELAETMDRLTVPNRLQDAVLAIGRAWRALLDLLDNQPSRQHEAIRILREPFGPVALGMARARALGLEDARQAAACEGLQRWFAGLSPGRVRPDFLPDGRRWMELGITPGRGLGELMTAVEDAALRGEILTRSDAESHGLDRG